MSLSKACIVFLYFIAFPFFGRTQLKTISTNDSLRSKWSYYYLSDLNLRTVAKLIVIDSVTPMDNEVTFRILDSVVDGNDATRSYFSKAFDYIIYKSDGALSEVMGIYLISSIEKHPNELLTWLSQSDKETNFQSVLDYIGYELSFSDDPVEARKTLIEKIRKDAKMNLEIQPFSENFIAHFYTNTLLRMGW